MDNLRKAAGFLTREKSVESEREQRNTEKQRSREAYRVVRERWLNEIVSFTAQKDGGEKM